MLASTSTKVMDGDAKFTQAHAEVPRRRMRNMRNRMAHVGIDINLDVVWDTTQERLHHVRDEAARYLLGRLLARISTCSLH